MAHLLAEKLDHSDDFLTQQNRKTKTRAQSGTLSKRSTRKVWILFQVRNPRGIAGLPDPSGQAVAFDEIRAQTRRLKTTRVENRAVPHVDAVQHFFLMIHGPKHPDLPTQTFANRFENLMRAFDEID